jgi:acyl-CoA thioester hydrolase
LTLKPDPYQLLESFDFSIPIQIRFSDIDGYLHVNNGVYFSYFEHARASFLNNLCDWNVMEVGTVVGRISIDYFKPIHLEDQITALVKCSRLGNASFDMEQYLVGKTANGSMVTFAQCNCVMVSVDRLSMKPTPIPDEFREKLSAKSA